MPKPPVESGPVAALPHSRERSDVGPRERTLSFRDCELDQATGELRRLGAVVHVTPQALGLLGHLVVHRDRVVSRDELFAAVWGDVTVSDGALSTAVYELRAVLGDDGRAQHAIRTVRGRGFRFVAPVSDVPARTGAPASAGSMAAPAPAGSRAAQPDGSAPFFGRREMLERLRGSVDAATRGPGRIVLLEGEAGIGKTSLVERLAAAVSGVSVYWGRCFEHAGTPPFWPWVPILRHCLARTTPAEVRRLFGAKAAAMIARMVAYGEGPTRGAERLATEADRFQLFDAVAGLLRRVGEEEPALLVIDDLHYADHPSLLLFEFLAGELATSHLVLIATYRSEDLDERRPSASTVSAVARHAHTEHYRLRGLAVSEVRDLLACVKGEDPSSALVDGVMRRTEGNPLFVKELARHIEPERYVSWALEPEPLPHPVREIIGRRIARLSSSAQDALAVAAVLGHEFSVDLLTRSWDASSSPRSMSWLTEAVRAHVVTVTGEGTGHVRFTHALYREALYARLDPMRRSLLHGRAADALEASCGSRTGAELSTLAHHCIAALPAGGSPERAAVHSIAAARSARAMLAYEEAVQHHVRALRALEWRGEPASASHAETLIELGEACALAGDAAAARNAFFRAADVARRGGSTEHLGRAALGYATVREAVIRLEVQPLEGADGRVTCGLLDAALNAVGTDDLALRARLLAALAVHSQETPGFDCAMLSREAQEIAERVGDGALLAEIIGVRREVLWTPEHVAQRRELAATLVALAQGAGDRELELRGRAWLLTDLLELGEIEQVRREMATCERLAGALRQPKYDHHVAVLRASLAVLDGRLDEAERLADDALRLGRRIRSWVADVIHMTHIVGIRREQGRLAEVEDTVRACVAGFPHPALRCVWTYFVAEMERLDEAGEEFERLAAGNFAALPRDRHWLGAVAVLCEVCARLGHRDGAAVLYDLLLPFAGRNVVSGEGLISLGAVSHHLGDLAGVLGRWSESERHFREALALNERLGARVYLGEIQRAFAGMLLARNAPGDRVEALGLIESGLEMAIRCGCHGLRRRLLLLRERAPVRLGRVREPVASGSDVDEQVDRPRR